MKATKLGKIKKSDFEDTLFRLNDEEIMGYRKHNDFDYEENTNTIVHLYYNDNGHIGSWSKGEGWYFKNNLTIGMDIIHSIINKGVK
jgi:hypothetical protein